MSDTHITAIILAGGKGTRLQSVVSDRPKALAEVAGRPFVEWLLLFLRAQGVRCAILATGYKGEMVEAHVGDGAPWSLDVRYARETVPLGTGGAARNALQVGASDPVLVLNGDSFGPFDVARLADAHRRAGARATLWLISMDDCRRYGAVDVAGDGRVVAFQEKSPAPRAGLVSAGVYLLQRSILEDIPTDRAVSLETEVFPALIGRGLYAIVGAGPFLDIGTPASYSRAEAFFSENRWLWHAVL